jgi:uridine phosphorylase
MGQPSLEIVVNEIVACNEIKLETKEIKTEWDMINIIRVGTSGALQKDTELGTPIVTKYTVLL